MSKAFLLKNSSLCLFVLLSLFGSSFSVRAESLSDAAHAGDGSKVRSLLEQGVDLEARDELGNTALHWAALNGDTALLKELLRKGADPNATNEDGATPLILAVRNLQNVKALVAESADVNFKSKLRVTPLLAASLSPQASRTLEWLLAHGADPQLEARFDLMDAAAENADLSALTALQKAGLTAHAVRGNSFPDDLEISKFLLAHGADPNREGGGVGHSLNNALSLGNLELAKLFIENGADLSMRSPGGQHETPTMLWTAYSETGDTSAAELMIENGADVNITSALGETALDWARARKNHALEKVLLDAGAKAGTRTPKVKIIPNNSIPEDPEALKPLIRNSITRSIELLQLTSDGFLNSGVVQRGRCTSCHQQTLPALAYDLARDRGYSLDMMSIARQVQDQARDWSKNNKIKKSLQLVSPQPSINGMGYGLLGLAALDYPLDVLTESMTRYIAAMQKPDGSWSARILRPPMADGPMVETAFALGALNAYPIPGLSEKLIQQNQAAIAYLRSAKPGSFNRQVFQLLGLVWAGEDSNALVGFAQAIIEKQQSDGGWAQLDGLPSDSWATGTALLALHGSGQVNTDDEIYQRGVRYLLRTQFEDGSWYVRSRAWPFQPHFESGFPHGKDQWISEGGTAWATIALLLTQPKLSEAKPVDWMAYEVPHLYARKVEVAKSISGSPANTPAVDFHRDIRPIFERSCTGCHGSDAKKIKGKFNIDKRQSFLTGGQSFDPVAIIGQGADSDLIWMVSDQLEDLEMPPLSKRDKYEALTPDEVELLKAWIDQGLPWGEEASDNL